MILLEMVNAETSMTAPSGCWVDSKEWREAGGDAVGDAETGGGTGDSVGKGVDVVETLGTELLLPPPKRDMKGLGMREVWGGVDALLVVGAETARCAGRGGSRGLTGTGAARGGRGREVVCVVRVKVGYSVDICWDDESRSGRMERAEGRVVGFTRS
jgi:hypothetical protein